MIDPARARAAMLALALSASLPSIATADTDRDLERYREPAFRDSVMSAYQSPGVVVLDRRFIEVTARGASAQAAIDHEQILFVRDPDRLGESAWFAFDESPGRDVRKIEAYRVSERGIEKLDVAESAAYACTQYRKHRRHALEHVAFSAGDVIAVRVRYALDGQNPVLEHHFDRSLPVMQSDVTFDVSKSLLEGKTPGVWAWWAGSFPGRVPQTVWEKPTSWRFRWGEASIPAGAEDMRSVLTSWVFDPARTGLGKLEATERRARGSDDIAYRGPTLGASQLTGMDHASRTHGPGESESGRPTEASYGELRWEELAELFVSARLESILRERHLPKLVARMLGDRGQRPLVEYLVAVVHERVALVDVPLPAALNDLHRPMETYASECGSAADKAICLVGVLRTQGIAAYPVLLKRSRLVSNLRSVEVFDTIGVIVEAEEGGRYIDVRTGRIHDSMPSGWSAGLTLNIDAPSRILLGDELAALARAAG